MRPIFDRNANPNLPVSDLDKHDVLALAPTHTSSGPPISTNNASDSGKVEAFNHLFSSDPLVPRPPVIRMTVPLHVAPKAPIRVSGSAQAVQLTQKQGILELRDSKQSHKKKAGEHVGVGTAQANARPHNVKQRMEKILRSSDESGGALSETQKRKQRRKRSRAKKSVEEGVKQHAPIPVKAQTVDFLSILDKKHPDKPPKRKGQRNDGVRAKYSHSTPQLDGSIDVYDLPQSPDLENQPEISDAAKRHEISTSTKRQQQQEGEDKQCRNSQKLSRAAQIVPGLEKQVFHEVSTNPIGSVNQRKRKLSGANQKANLDFSANLVERSSDGERPGKRKRVISQSKCRSFGGSKLSDESVAVQNLDALPTETHDTESELSLDIHMRLASSPPLHIQEPGDLVPGARYSIKERSSASPTSRSRDLSPELGDVSLISPAIVAAARLRRLDSPEVPESVYGGDDWVDQTSQHLPPSFRSDHDLLVDVGSERNKGFDDFQDSPSGHANQHAVDTQILMDILGTEEDELSGAGASGEPVDCNITLEPIKQNGTLAATERLSKAIDKVHQDPDIDRSHTLATYPVPSDCHNIANLRSPRKRWLSPAIMITASPKRKQSKETQGTNQEMHGVLPNKENTEMLSTNYFPTLTIKRGIHDSFSKGEETGDAYRHGSQSNVHDANLSPVQRGFYRPMICQIQ
jgi:hypothetical protein